MSSATALMLLIPCCLLNAQSGASHYVAPDGSPSGDGSLARPWDLQTALYQPASVHPGDIIWVRGGVYGNGSQVFYSRLVGTTSAPIIVRRYSRERAVINAWLQVGCCDQDPQPSQGAYTWFWGLEFASSILDRTGAPAGPPYYGASVILDAVDTWAPGTKFINNVIHDTRTGISMWQEAQGAEAYGNIIYFNGFQASDRGHGHGFYVQNNTGTMTIADNIIFDQFDNGMQFYGTTNANVRNLLVQGNVSFNNGMISSGPQPGDDVIFANGNGVSGVQLLDNYFYFTPHLDLGYNELGWTAPNADITINGNYFMGGFEALAFGTWSFVDFENNRVYSRDKYLIALAGGNATSAYKWNHNSYFGSGLFMANGSGMFFGGWPTATGLDSASTFVPTDPTGIWTFVRPNKYEAGRANIVVYNWDLASAISVDLSAILAPGTPYEILDAENFFGRPVVMGRYAGSPVTIPMTGLSIATPSGGVPTHPTHTAPQFATFVLLTREILPAVHMRIRE